MVQTGYAVLVDAGYDPVMANFEVYLRLKADRRPDLPRGTGRNALHKVGHREVGDALANRAQVTAGMRELMEESLGRSQSGEFAKEWIAMKVTAYRNYTALLQAAREHPIEQVGAELPQADEPFINAGNKKVVRSLGRIGTKMVKTKPVGL